MKMKIEVRERQSTLPVIVCLEIQSEEELIALWKRLNINCYDADSLNSKYKDYPCHGHTDDLWDAIDNILLALQSHKGE